MLLGRWVGALLIFSLKADETEIEQQTKKKKKCRLPTISTVADGTLYARCSAAHFSPGSKPITPILETQGSERGVNCSGSL